VPPAGAKVFNRLVVTPTVAMRRTARCRSSKTLFSVLLAVGAFLAAGPAAAAIQSDEFNGPTLDTGIWTLVDPVGDATVSMTGSQAMISLPEGVAHDIWANVDRAPRLLQPVANEDFEVEVKYDSAVSFAYQMQGLIVQQDAGNLLRIEVHSDGDSTRLFVAAIQGGSGTVLHYSTVSGGSPVYLRLQRVGNDWTLRHSLNGSSWTTATFTHALAVSEIGPYAGNSGVFPPAFSARVDYFREIVADVTPPAISGVAAAPTALGATITWNTNEPASTVVAYGLDATYAGGVVAQAALVQSHSIELQGLACGTTYHFQARSSDGAGNEGQSGDQAFTTPACPTAVRSDEFNGGALDTSVWSYVDPVGDTSLSMTGTQAAIGIPAGAGHDIWTGVNRSPRLLQPLANQDFEVEVKFDSAVTTAFQMQGLIVQQDPQNLLRLEVHGDGTDTKLFAASVQNGTASTQVYRGVSGGPQAYLRLKRVGNTWTLSYSKDGSTWLAVETFTHALTVSALGPFAGNSGGTPPAFTAKVDYFREIVPDVTPPAFSGVAVAPGAATAQVTWTTDEPASSEVVYGPTTAYESGSVRNEARVVSHQLALHGLACASTFHYQVRSVDAAGNEGQSADGTFATAPCPTVIASDEFNSGTLDEGVWTFIDPVGDSTLALTGSEARIGVPAGTRHDLWGGVDEVPRLLQAAPNANFSVEAKFTSAGSSAYQMQGIVVEQDVDDILRIETHHDGGKAWIFIARISGATASTIEYREIPGGAPVWLRVTRAGDHWTVLYSLDGSSWGVGGSFTEAFAVSAIGPYGGNSGNAMPAFTAGIDYFREITDRTPPVITNTATSVRSRSAVVTWTTDEPADSRVDFGTAAPSGNARSSPKLETRHSVTLDSLACATTYQFRVASSDALGNVASGSQASFTTAACTAGGGPDIDVWYGDNQTFGAVGIPQNWVNVVGNISDPDGVASASAWLNDEPPMQLGLGPDGWRLERPGDFNVDLNRAALVPGLNQLEIRAVDSLGNVSVRNVTVNWQGQSAGATPPANGPVLVVAAHPDDEALGTAGIIQRARAEGRRVYVAMLTNGDFGTSASVGDECGSPDPEEAAAAALGLRRDAESRNAMAHLGLSWTNQLLTTEIIYLGYPDGRLVDVAISSDPLTSDRAGLHRTYAEDYDGNRATCNGDFRMLLSGHHSQLTAATLAADLDALLTLAQPSDVYTHASFDGHPDHAETYRQVAAALKRSDTPARLHATIMHPEDTGSCMALSAAQWPNPALANNDPFARFTPTLDVTAPPVPACSQNPTGTDWGPFGAPNELVEVPAAMQITSEATNLKWQAIAEYETQLDCTNPSDYHVTCGYMRTFVKKHEFFWQWLYGTARQWPQSYTTSWSSNASIAAQAQITDGEWRYENGGVRPLTTGFDRLLVLGDAGWRDYDVRVPFTLHSSDQSKDNAGVGVALGWQGHTAWGQPRVGHPTGGLCMYARGQMEPAPFKLQIGYSPGPTDDTLVAVQDPPQALAVGVAHVMRFRQERVAAGTTRYSCKVWRDDAAEPAGWTLVADIPDWPGESDQHPGSSVLVAHNVDATFGNVTITPLGG